MADYNCPKCGRDILAFHQTQTAFVREQMRAGRTTCDLTESSALMALVDSLAADAELGRAVRWWINEQGMSMDAQDDFDNILRAYRANQEGK